MIGTILIFCGLIAGLIGIFTDPDSDFLPFIFIIFIVFLVFGLVLKGLECI